MGLAVARPSSAVAQDGLPLLTNVAQIQRLSIEEARRGYPVELRGVVTYYEPKWESLFVQDETGGIYIFPSDQPRPQYQAGQLVKVQGRSAASSRLTRNSIVQEAISIVGSAPLPTPAPVSFEQVAGGRHDSQWVEAEGTVRAMWTESQRNVIRLAMAGGVVEIHMPGEPLPEPLLYGRIRAQGVCSVAVNSQDQVTDLRLFSPGIKSLLELKAAPSDPFDAPLQSLEAASAFNSKYLESPRVRVAGLVTLASPSGLLGLQNEQAALQAELFTKRLKNPLGRVVPSVDHPLLEPGDRVEVVGYPALREFAPTLEDCVVRKVGAAIPPAPVKLTGPEAASGQYHGRLVQIQARLIEALPASAPQAAVQRLEFRSGDVFFEGHFEGPERLVARPQTIVRVSGVCNVAFDEHRKPRSFLIRMRTPADLAVLRLPPRWLTTDVLRILAVCGGALAAGFGWVLLLRRQVRQRTAELRASEARYRTLVEHAPEAIVVLDADTGRFVEANDNAVRLFGADRKTLMEMGPGDLSPALQPDGRHSREAAMDKVREALANGAPRFEWVHRNLPGKEIPCEVNLVRLPAPGRNLVRGNVIDISERKRAEQALREREQQQRAFLDNQSDLAWMKDREGRYIAVNQALARELGRLPADIVGKTDAELYPASFADQYRADDHIVVEARATHRFEEAYPDHQGRTVQIETIKSPIFNDAGEVTGTVGVARDITDRKLAEAELVKTLARERELGELKSSFVTMVSHEFRTPLEVIMSSGEILERYFERLPVEERNKHLKVIHSSVKRMAGMMEDVLLLGKVEAGRMKFKPESFDLRTFCVRLVDEILSATNYICPIEVKADKVPDTAHGDESLLRHIFTNLLSNAVKYSSPGQQVCFSIAHENGLAVFRVIDQGVGIPVVDQERLFQAFYRGRNTTHIAGSGLGLVVVKRCVQMHAGKIRCDSEEGKGTTFTVWLPLFGEGLDTSLDTALFFQRGARNPVPQA